MAVFVVLAGPFLLVSLNAAQTYDLRPWGGDIPTDALIAGENASGSALYVCVASSWGGEHPGALDAGGVCEVAWGGQGHRFDDDFKVVTDPGGSGGTWVHMPEGGIPPGAFAAGNDGGSIFVCRVNAGGGLRIGKLTDEEWCYVADAGEEKTFTSDYEVLVE